jgi:hypothetical protein
METIASTLTQDDHFLVTLNDAICQSYKIKQQLAQADQMPIPTQKLATF